MPISEQLIDVKGNTVRYYEAGEPHHRSLLLLHGGFGDAWLHWSEVIAELEEDYHLIAPDLPGYGQSAPLADLTVDKLLAWTLDLMDALGLDQAGIVGQSFGGLVGRLLAAQVPNRVPVLVLVNGGVIPSVPGIARFIARTPGLGRFMFRRIARSTSSRSGLAGVFEDGELLTDEFVQRVGANLNGLAALMQALAASPIPEKRTPRIPVLLLWGEEDSITPRVVGEHIHSNIPDSKLSLIAACRHMPHLETQEIFVWQVNNFLNELNRTRH
jgi:pimeloyl-ACP methyl ester carboxylesterase